MKYNLQAKTIGPRIAFLLAELYEQQKMISFAELAAQEQAIPVYVQEPNTVTHWLWNQEATIQD